MNQATKKRLLPVGIIGSGLLIAGILIATGEKAEKAPITATVIPVEVLNATPADVPIPVRGTGVVQAAQQVALVPQISGKVVTIADALRPGGRFATGEVLANIEQLDYRAAFDLEMSRLRQAELELSLEIGRGEVAEREWALLHGESSGASDLALRRPHRAVAEQQLAAARGSVERARANLNRTRLEAPFNAIVVEENIDIGQVVGPGAPVATLVGTDELWVRVSVPVSELDVIQFGDAGSPARVIQRVADGRKIEYSGQALQLAGQLDPQTRLAQIIVAVANPFEQEIGSLPLLPGAYVEVVFDGLIAAQAFRISRSAIYEGSHVWLAKDGQLSKQDVVISGGDASHVLVTGGLMENDAVITSGLSLPIDGAPIERVGN